MLQYDRSQFINSRIFVHAFALIPCAVNENGFFNRQIVECIMPKTSRQSSIRFDFVSLEFEQSAVTVAFWQFEGRLQSKMRIKYPIHMLRIVAGENQYLFRERNDKIYCVRNRK